MPGADRRPALGSKTASGLTASGLILQAAGDKGRLTAALLTVLIANTYKSHPRTMKIRVGH